MKSYICLLLLLLTSPLLAQTTRYVTTNGANTNPATATNWASSTADLRGAINASTSGDQVWVAAGVYTTVVGLTFPNRNRSFALKNGVAIYGGFVGNETNLSQRPAINPVAGLPSSTTLSGEIGDPTSTADNNYHVVSTTGLTSSAVLDGFVITAGEANGTTSYSIGGGMYNINSSPHLNNLTFALNRSSYDGAGMYNTGGSPTLGSILFINNYGGGFGGGMCSINGTPRLTNVLFQSNIATNGGGMHNDGSSSILTNVAFLGNFARDFGGAMSGVASMPQLTNVTFRNNSTRFGNSGGAIYNAYGDGPVLTNCVLFGSGGGDSIKGGGTVATNSLFDNTVTGYGSSATNLTTGVSPFAATNGVALAACSPAINAGNNSAPGLTGISTDLAGNPRQVGAWVDMGAVEFQASPSFPARLYVNASATGGNTGLSWADALTDLQSALTYPCPQSLTEIWVAGGVYKPTTSTGPASRSISFAMLPGVAIYGGFVGNETTLSSRPAIQPRTGQPSSSTLSGEIGDPSSLTDNSYHVVSTTGLTGSAVLDGFVITAGKADGYGTYSMGVGGGFYNSASSPTLQNLSFLNNQVLNDGAGMYNIAGSNPAITNCLFSGNSAFNGYAGGISNDGSSPVLTNVSFVKNGSYSGGGGIRNSSGSSPRLTNVLFVSNSSTYGGGLYNSSNSNPTLVNVAFIGNSGGYNGGGLYNTNNSNPQLTNVSFLNNRVSLSGAGFGGGAIYNGSGSTSLTNCVMFGNGGSNSIQGSSVTATYSLFENTVTGYSSSATNLTTAVSPFASLSSVALAANSPAINAGNLGGYTTANGPATDLPGNPRIVNGSIDMGAVEFQVGETIYTVQNGNWSDASTWSVNRLPIAGESIGINHAVQVNGTFQIKRVVYGPGARLIFNSGGRIQF